MKPTILAVDDDPDVLNAVERDLRKQYGNRFRVLRAESGSIGLELLKRLKLRNDPTALLLVDQRMPQITGVDFLQEAMEIFPDAKRVLLTAYADTDAAIRSINKAKIDFYLMKPWTPPEQNLYPVLDDLLDDWMASFHPEFEGIRVIGLRWSAKSHEIRDFLARNGVPFQWLDIEADNEARRLASYASSTAATTTVSSFSNISKSATLPHLPLVILPDGSQLMEPTTTQLAEKIGLKSHAQMPFYDLIIVGAGPAGLAAAVYGASEGLHTLLIEKEAPGGQAGMSSNIENYLGFPTGLTGANLARRAVAQAARFGAEILTPQQVTGIRIEGPYRFVKLVYYGAAMVQALSYKGENVCIVGGANSAGQAAIHFSKYASKVIMLVRGDSLTKGMSQYLVDQINETKNIDVMLSSNIEAVNGEERLESVTIYNSKNGENTTFPISSIFIFIGAQPRTDWLSGVIERDRNGFILTGPDLMLPDRNSRPRGWTVDRDPFLLETNIPGVFAAGDVRLGSVKRVASGVGEGAIAIQFVHQYLTKV
jgi:thioredoxin reductase (NADPH)